MFRFISESISVVLFYQLEFWCLGLSVRVVQLFEFINDFNLGI